jgi:hypothetical protein
MNAPTTSAVFTRTPEPGYRIPEAARAKLPPAIDTEVLEALLARVRPEYRAEMLDMFQQISAEAQGRPVAFGPMVGNTGDPEIDALVSRLRRVPPSEEGWTGRKQ